MLLSFLLLIWWFKRRRASTSYELSASSDEMEGASRPYTKYPVVTIPSARVPSQGQFREGEGAEQSFSTPPLSLSSKQGVSADQSPSSRQSSVVHTHETTQQASSGIVVHADSGLRGPEMLLVDVPPSYTSD